MQHLFCSNNNNSNLRLILSIHPRGVSRPRSSSTPSTTIRSESAILKAFVNKALSVARMGTAIKSRHRHGTAIMYSTHAFVRNGCEHNWAFCKRSYFFLELFRWVNCCLISDYGNTCSILKGRKIIPRRFFPTYRNKEEIARELGKFLSCKLIEIQWRFSELI